MNIYRFLEGINRRGNKAKFESRDFGTKIAGIKCRVLNVGTECGDCRVPFSDIS